MRCRVLLDQGHIILIAHRNKLALRSDKLIELGVHQRYLLTIGKGIYETLTYSTSTCCKSIHTVGKLCSYLIVTTNHRLSLPDIACYINKRHRGKLAGLGKLIQLYRGSTDAGRIGLRRYLTLLKFCIEGL